MKFLLWKILFLSLAVSFYCYSEEQQSGGPPADPTKNDVQSQHTRGDLQTLMSGGGGQGGAQGGAQGGEEEKKGQQQQGGKGGDAPTYKHNDKADESKKEGEKAVQALKKDGDKITEAIKQSSQTMNSLFSQLKNTDDGSAALGKISAGIGKYSEQSNQAWVPEKVMKSVDDTIAQQTALQVEAMRQQAMQFQNALRPAESPDTGMTVRQRLNQVLGSNPSRSAPADPISYSTQLSSPKAQIPHMSD